MFACYSLFQDRDPTEISDRPGGSLGLTCRPEGQFPPGRIEHLSGSRLLGTELERPRFRWFQMDVVPFTSTGGSRETVLTVASVPNYN